MFSELLKKAIEEAEALFDHPTKQYALFQGFEEEVRARKTPGIPDELADNRHAKAYFGLFRLVAGDEAVDAGMADDPETLISLARQVDETVQTVVAQNTLNPTGVDKGIRKALLPTLFQRFGLDKANELLDQIVHIVRVGLNHD